MYHGIQSIDMLYIKMCKYNVTEPQKEEGTTGGNMDKKGIG